MAKQSFHRQGEILLFQHSRVGDVPSIAFKRGHETRKHVLIEC